MVFVAIFFTIFGGILFLSPQGAASWLNVAANLGIIAVPVGFLMIAGELDISIGAMVPAAPMTIGIISGYYGLPIWFGILATLAFGALVGLINGLVVIRTAVPSLIVTMGTLFAVAGLMLFLSIVLTNTTSVSMPAIAPWAKTLFGSFVGGTFQVLIFWWLGLSAIYYFFLHLSPWGNWVFALGGDKVSARNAGIPTDKPDSGAFRPLLRIGRLRRHVPDDPLQLRASLGRAKLHLQHHHLGRCRRRPPDRRFRLGDRHLLGTITFASSTRASTSPTLTGTCRALSSVSCR